MGLSLLDWLIIDGWITVKDAIIITVVIPLIIFAGFLAVCWWYENDYNLKRGLKRLVLRFIDWKYWRFRK